MNKQQLAAKIWESANKMRSKIEANEYKDYILGFIFYKFLSEKEVKYLKENDWTDEYLPDLTEEDIETVESVQKNLGYFISYDNLFSTWLSKGRDFSVQDVRDALSAFSRLINTTHKKVFEGVFDTLQTGLSKLGDSSASQSKAISDLIHLIKDIPMDGNWNINESVFTLRPNLMLVEPEYIYHTIHSDIVLNQIINGITGSTFKSIKIGDLKKVNIPVPSKAEQKQIAAFSST